MFCELPVFHVAGWVLEGSMAGVIWYNKMALDFACRLGFWCNRHCIGAKFGRKSYRCIWFGDVHGPKANRFIGTGDTHGRFWPDS